MTDHKLVLIVDDEPGILDIVQMYFVREGFRLALACDGEAALQAIGIEPPDLVILDLMLPKINGLDVCRRLRRQSQIPVIILTARDEDIDKIIGLELGADDYITKPFNPRELVARAKAVLRRAEGSIQSPPLTDKIEIGDLHLNQVSRLASFAKKTLALSPREFDLLWTLAAHPGQVFGRKSLIELVWGYEFPGGTRTVDIHIAQLRKKLADAGVKNPIINTVQRSGYRLDPLATNHASGK